MYGLQLHRVVEADRSFYLSEKPRFADDPNTKDHLPIIHLFLEFLKKTHDFLPTPDISKICPIHLLKMHA